MSQIEPDTAESSTADPAAEVLGGRLDEQDEIDPAFVERLGGSLFRFLHDVYWRVDVHGIERIPSQGGGVVVGIHRGFMPFDAMMLVHSVAGAHRRIPRFLIHPGLLRFGPVAKVIRKLGGLLATRENGDRVLASGELLGLYPEGVGGAFALYRDAHRLQRTGRPEYVRMALRNRVPIIPQVTVGPAEIFPVFHQFHWQWWKKATGWPCFPITPTFPLLPLPLPSRWHTWVLEPLPVHEQYPPEAAGDRQLVRELGREVEGRISAALGWMVERRPGLFRGSLLRDFDEAAAWQEAVEKHHPEPKRLASEGPL